MDEQIRMGQMVERPEGTPSSLSLLSDYPRTGRGAGTARRERLQVLPGLSLAVEARAREEGVPESAVLLAGWQALLFRLSDQSDFVVGIPIGTRTSAHDQGLRGFYGNLLPVRASVSGGMTFRELLRAAGDALGRAALEGDAPLERLIPSREAEPSPIFETVFVPPEEPWMSFATPRGLEVSPAFIDSGTAASDFTLRFERRADGGLDACLEHRTDIYSEDTARRWLARWMALLAAALDAPETGLDDLTTHAPGEFAEVVTTFNDTERSYDGALRLHDFLTRSARATPEAVALEFGSVRVSYRDVDDRAEALAERLEGAGLVPGDTVAVFMRRSEWLPVALFGILRAGGAYVPIDPNLPADRIRFLLEDCGARVALVDADLELPTGSTAKACRLPESAAVAEETVASTPRRDPAGPRDLAYVIYTSGSTGKPKGSLVEHRSIVNRLLWMQEKYPFTPDDVQLQSTTISFDVSVIELFMWSVAGARLALPPPGAEKDPAAIIEAVRAHRVTRLNFVPSMMGAFLAHVRSARLSGELSTLRHVYCTGEALPGAMVREFDELIGRRFGTTLHNLYGPTEAAVEVSWFDCADYHNQTSVPIGRPVANTQLYVLDTRGRPTPVGCAGELHISGVQVARGYLNRPDLTAEKFVVDPFSSDPEARMYRTGDLARWLADGTLEYLGRTDFQIKIRGVRVEPGEIEAALLELPSVGTAAVIAHDGPGSGKMLVGYVTPRGGVAKPKAGDLLAALRSRLPSQLIPASIIVLDQLPLGSAGKLNRRALPPPVFETAEAAGVSERDLLSSTLAAIWQEELGLRAVDPRAQFFDQGGHSLLAVRMLARIRAETGAVVALTDFLRDASFGALERRVRAAIGMGEAPVVVPRVARGQPVVVSAGQRQLWFLHQLDASGAGHNIIFVLVMDGALEPAALQAAVDAALLRHEALRTIFPAFDGEPMQVILPPGDPRGPHLQVEPEGDPGANGLAVVLAEEDRRAFDLGRGPLFVARLVALEATRHALVLNLHHIIADESAEELLFRDIAAAYSAHLGDRTGELPEPGFQPADLAVWQKASEQERQIEEQLGWWKDTLASAAPALPLPADHPRKSRIQFTGQRVFAIVPPERAALLDRATRAAGVTPFVGFLAAWSSFLGRLCAQDDIVVGAPVSLRTGGMMSEAVGFFVNPLPFRLRCNRGWNFAQLLHHTREVVLGVFAHAQTPFARIVEHVKPERIEGATPVFQVMMVMRGPATRPPEMRGLTTSVVDHHPGSAKVDLTLLVAEREGCYELALEYRDDRFDRPTVEGWLDDFVSFLMRACEDPTIPVHAISCVAPQELARQLDVAKTDDLEIPETETLCALVANQAARRTDMPAIVCDGAVRLTFGDLEHAAAAWAAAIRGCLRSTEPRVGICFERSPGMIVAMLAAMRAGAAYVPIDPAWPQERVQWVLDDAAVDVVLADDGDAAARILAVLESRPRIRVFRIDSSRPLERLPAEPMAATGATPLSPAYMIYTSGSTGRPKGVVVEHRHIVASTLARLRVYGGAPGRFLLLSPAVFDSSVAGLFWTLTGGGTLVLPAPGTERDPAAIADVILRERVTTTLCLPSVHALLLEELRGRQTSLRRVIVAGEPCPLSLPAAHRAALPGVRLFNEYGPTEASVWCTVADITDEYGDAAVPIGRPIPGARVYIVDDSYCLLPRGAAGEIVIAGRGVARGYHQRPGLTAERFIDGPFTQLPESRIYRSGDLGKCLPDGRLVFCGRMDDQIKLRGYRIEPGEIEAALREHPDTHDALVLGVDHAKTGRALAAYIVRRGGSTGGTIDELKEFLRTRLPEHMVPAFFVFLDRLPLNSNGKVDRQALPSVETAALHTPRRHEPPRNTLEAQLVGVWEDLLGVRPVGVRDDFFEIGGHSLLAVKLTHEIGRATGRTVSLPMVLAARTIEEMALQLQRPAGGAASALRPVLRGKGAGTTLFNIPGYGGIGVMHKALAMAVENDRRYFDGLVLPGVDGSEAPLERTEEIAATLISHIRLVQPHGPYALTGFCLGGLFAFEVAQQLTAAGEEVRALALWHAFPTHLWRERSRMERMAFAVRSLATGLPSTSRGAFLKTCVGSELAGLRQRLGRAARRILRHNSASHSPIVVDSPWKQAQSRAGSEYRMRPYAGSTLVLRATELSPKESLRYKLPPLWGWEYLARGEFEMCDFGCEYMELLDEPLLTQVAAKTAAWLRSTDSAAARDSVISRGSETLPGGGIPGGRGDSSRPHMLVSSDGVRRP